MITINNRSSAWKEVAIYAALNLPFVGLFLFIAVAYFIENPPDEELQWLAVCTGLFDAMLLSLTYWVIRNFVWRLDVDERHITVSRTRGETRYQWSDVVSLTITDNNINVPILIGPLVVPLPVGSYRMLRLKLSDGTDFSIRASATDIQDMNQLLVGHGKPEGSYLVEYSEGLQSLSLKQVQAAYWVHIGHSPDFDLDKSQLIRAILQHLGREKKPVMQREHSL